VFCPGHVSAGGRIIGLDGWVREGNVISRSRFGCGWVAVCLLGLVACGEPAPTVRSAPPATATPSPSPSSKPVRTPTPKPAAQPLPLRPTVPAGVAMPNPRLTPGATFAGVTAGEVCTSGWATAHRHVTATQYHEVYGEYGIRYPEPFGTYELDHLIPLELGGDNANANLWPEPASPTPGFHQKDDLENTLHDLVCAGSLSLTAAQHDIASNWYAAYLRYV
jgi:hypothetical protein